MAYRQGVKVQSGGGGGGLLVADDVAVQVVEGDLHRPFIRQYKRHGHFAESRVGAGVEEAEGVVEG